MSQQKTYSEQLITNFSGFSLPVVPIDRSCLRLTGVQNEVGGERKGIYVNPALFISHN
jgi:hypothetical protein